MGKTLEALYRLQDVELKLAELRRQREVRLRRIGIHQRGVQKTEEKLEQIRATALDCQKRQDALQLDSAARDADLDKHREALNCAKTNKEYAAILTAMNTEKADNSKLETEILQLMESIQTLKDQSEAFEVERAKSADELARAEKLLKDHDKGCKAQKGELKGDRERCAEDIPPTALATFDRVAEHHDGEAMAPVLKIHPKRDEYACSGCNMNIALEVVNTLFTRDDIQECRVCGRILCIDSAAAQKSNA